MVMDSEIISSKATKLEEITVNRQSSQLIKPSIITTAVMETAIGNTTKRHERKMRAKVTIINSNTAVPNTTKSLRIKLIISAVIMVIPPTNICASLRYLSTTLRTSATRLWARASAVVR